MPRTGARAAPSLERELVHVAPEPVLAGLGGPDDRVLALRVVRGGVTVRRVVAAADVPARRAHPQVHPRTADLQAILAAGDLVRNVADGDRVEMGAGCTQRRSPSPCSSSSYARSRSPRSLRAAAGPWRPASAR